MKKYLQSVFLFTWKLCHQGQGDLRMESFIQDSKVLSSCHIENKSLLFSYSIFHEFSHKVYTPDFYLNIKKKKMIIFFFYSSLRSKNKFIFYNTFFLVT